MRHPGIEFKWWLTILEDAMTSGGGFDGEMTAG